MDSVNKKFFFLKAFSSFKRSFIFKILTTILFMFTLVVERRRSKENIIFPLQGGRKMNEMENFCALALFESFASNKKFSATTNSLEL